MKYRVVAIGEAPAPTWVKDRLPTLPQKPEPRTVYLLMRPPEKNFPALAYDPSKAPEHPAFYYNPTTLSTAQIELAHLRYRHKKMHRSRMRSQALDEAAIYYVLFDEAGYVQDFNVIVAKASKKYLGKVVYRGMHYRELVLPENLTDFEADFKMALAGESIRVTRRIQGRMGDIVMAPLAQGGRRSVVYLAIDITVHHQLLEAFAMQRKISEVVANNLLEGILTFHQERGLTFANTLAEAILGPEITNTALLSHLIAHPQGYLSLRDRLLHWETRSLPENDLYLILLRDITQLYNYEQENQVLRQAWEIGPTGITILAEQAGELSALYMNAPLREWFPASPSDLWRVMQKHLSREERRRLAQALAHREKGEFQLTGAYTRHGWSRLRMYLYPFSLAPLEVYPPQSTPPVWSGQLWIVIVQDETVLYQAARRRLLLEARQTRLILQAQEQERQRLAEALHDQVGGLLSFIRMSLSTLLPEAPLSFQEKLQTLLQHVDEVIRSVRLTSHLLMPPLVEHFSLQSVVEGLVRRFDQAIPTMRFSLSVRGEEPPLSTQQKLSIYRIVQELLTNALKHSQATNVQLCLRFKARRLTIEVCDNGRGYNPRHLPEAGIGLQSISARLKLLKAAYQDRSEPGKGSHFILEVPIRRQAPSPKR